MYLPWCVNILFVLYVYFILDYVKTSTDYLIYNSWDYLNSIINHDQNILLLN